MNRSIGALWFGSLLLFCLPAASNAVCTFVCPAGDDVVFPEAPFGARSPDFNLSFEVDLSDLAFFASHYPPNPYDMCADFDNDGAVNLVDFALFGSHYRHAGAAAFVCV